MILIICPALRLIVNIGPDLGDIVLARAADKAVMSLQMTTLHKPGVSKRGYKCFFSHSFPCWNSNKAQTLPSENREDALWPCTILRASSAERLCILGVSAVVGHQQHCRSVYQTGHFGQAWQPGLLLCWGQHCKQPQSGSNCNGQPLQRSLELGAVNGCLFNWRDHLSLNCGCAANMPVCP